MGFDAVSLQKQQLRLVNIIIGVIALAYATFWIWLGHLAAGVTCVVSVVIATSCYFWQRRIEYSRPLVLVVLGQAALNITTLLTMFWGELPVLLAFLTLGPLLAMVFLSPKDAGYWAIAVVVMILAAMELSSLINWGSWAVPLSSTWRRYLNAVQGVSVVLIALVVLRMLRDHYDRLLAEQVAQTQLIADSQRAIEQAQRSKDRFFATVSHELRTPMNAIVGISNLLRSEQTSPSERHDLTHALGHSSNLLLSIINDLLDLSRLQEDKMTILAVDFDVREVIIGASSVFRFAATEKGLSYQVHIAPAVPNMVRGDGHRLSQVVVNLLSNAVKFTKSGSIELRVTGAAGVLPSDPYLLRIEVSDTGMGISPTALANLFQEFSQADATIAPRFGGSGLGLSIAKKLINLMGGDIRVQSKEGEGTLFVVEVPFEQTKQVRRTARPAVPALGALDAKILIVDDNQLNRMVAEKQIEQSVSGVTIVHAKDGREAISLIEQDDFDLVLMDIQMPVMDGLTASKRIRQLSNPAKANIPIVVVSANAGEGGLADAQAIGITDTLLKPFAASTLVSVLHKYLRTNAKSGEPAAAVPHRPASPFAQGVAAPKCVLVADDNAVNLMLMQRLLHRCFADTTVVTANSAEQALTRLGETKVDLVLMDIEMPGMTGIEATAVIRSLTDRKQAAVPIVALTAHSEPAELQRCLDAGMNAVLGRDFSPEKLTAALAPWLGIKQSPPSAPTTNKPNA